MSVSSGNVMKIYKYFVCTGVEECSSTREADGHASISKKKNEQVFSFSNLEKYTEITLWFGSLLWFLSCEAHCPGLGFTSDAVNTALLEDNESK